MKDLDKYKDCDECRDASPEYAYCCRPLIAEIARLEAELAELRANVMVDRALAMKAVCEAARELITLDAKEGLGRYQPEDLSYDAVDKLSKLQQALAALDAVEKGEEDEK